MPYITQGKRNRIDPYLEQINEIIYEKGELTYCLYKLCSLYLKTRRISYETLSTTMSCLEDAKLEWHRKRMIPYEDKKIRENGDIE